MSKVDATVLRPLARSLHDLLGAVQNVGLDDFAMNHADVDHQRLSDVGIEPLSQAVQDPPSQEWMYAYVQFDGWDCKIVVDDDAGVDGGCKHHHCTPHEGVPVTPHSTPNRRVPNEMGLNGPWRFHFRRYRQSAIRRFTRSIGQIPRK
ncbi:MAG TPA: hypothetical protein VJ978_08985 [Nitriliruptoraceae bacterium]|nr:hypothetical protein [Nitriliruptoraceae bacterium]